jgi:hypothetical protein
MHDTNPDVSMQDAMEMIEMRAVSKMPSRPGLRRPSAVLAVLAPLLLLAAACAPEPPPPAPVQVAPPPAPVPAARG